MSITTRNVVAIGLDAAAPEWIRRLIDRGSMPNLAALLSQGRWLEIESGADIGSGAVWPTFITGTDAAIHGIYGEWVWQPSTMDITRYRGSELDPFWTQLISQGLRVGVLDVPFMPMIGMSDGFEISEWGAHDVLEGKTEIGPANVAAMVRKHGKHPLAAGTTVSGPDDYKNLEKLGEGCLSGATLRGTLARQLLNEINPQLALIVFPETHRCGHYLWHAAEPQHQIYQEDFFNNLTATEPNLIHLYQEIDRQIGQIVNSLNDTSAVMVFSLHGMQPAHGIPAFLGALLCEAGFSKLTGWDTQTWGERARGLLAKTKQRLPAGMKKLYYSIAPKTTTHRVARSTMLPQYDWTQTRAFSLPTDQHGWIRINLQGREAKGIVQLQDYDQLCNELQGLLRGLTAEDGRPLVRKVLRTANAEEALSQNIPDIVIHWDDAAFSSNLRIKHSNVRVENIGKKYVAQHAGRGFCILSGAFEAGEQDVLHGKDLHQLLIETLNAQPARRSVAAV